MHPFLFITHLSVVAVLASVSNLSVGQTDYSEEYQELVNSCNKGDLQSCDVLGTALISKPTDWKSKVNVAVMANHFYKKACNGGHMPGCINLGVMYGLGAGFEGGELEQINQNVDYRWRRQVSLYGQACENGRPLACSYLAYNYEYGLGVEVNYARAVKLLEQACISGDGYGCNTLAIKLYEAKEYDSAIAYFRRGCDLELSVSCSRIAVQYTYGYGVKKDYYQALGWYERACEMGDPSGCDQVRQTQALIDGVSLD